MNGYVERWGRRWPVVDGIPFLRRGREALADRALAALESGDEANARIELLGDQDDWWPFGLPDAAARARAVRARSLRAAMDALGYGPVGDYFAYRWSDPTFLSGLALLERHGGTQSVFELACGIGHFLRELAVRGVRVAGGDIVFSKLWLCRRFVAPDAELTCFDAAGPFPLPDGAYATALCHDALHYLPDKAHAVAELRRIAPRVLIGHAHNAHVDNLSPGAPLTGEEYLELVPGAAVYDDAQLGAALLADRPPRALSGADSPEAREAAALAFAWPAGSAPGPRLSAARPQASLRLNPLLDPATLDVRWPSERYRDEYAELSGHLAGVAPDRESPETLYRRRVMLDLPEAW